MSVIVGKTIDQLNAATAITANDEVAIYDAEAGAAEPTKKVTGSNLASSIKTLGSLLGTSDVVNDLTSTATDKPLSANQGRWLKSYIDEAICIYELSFSNISVPAMASTSVSYSFPHRDGYSRAFLSPPYSISGSGSGLVIVTIHGDASGGAIHLGSATSNAITVATLKIRCVYVKNNIYKNITPV